MRGRDLPDEEGDHIELAKFIRARRAELGLARREAARKAGISEATWRMIEIGRPTDDGLHFSAPTIDTLNRIASVLQLEGKQLRKVAGNHIKTDSRPATIGPVESRAIDVAGLTDDQIDLLQQIADSYKQGKRR
ncbi:helix-turn-helix domain-containing protein [Rhodococcus qingshengii]|uniref:helix-turn-helix domain-containing protein n=1 Tax=Rhodococcus qingshengii TaxID=334542 RepID=UPI0037C76B34